jgi:hypothetical protein
MQLRFEVEGDELVRPCGLDALSAFMQSYGVACQEFVGKKDKDGKTPITFQVMISKEHFDQLYPIATSKSPILPFSAKREKIEQVPSQLLNLAKGYLGLRIANYTHKNQLIRIDNAKISVNEAPATRCKVVRQQAENGREVILVGDAALGLSYFKGLNAGIENAAKLLPALCSSNKSDLEHYEKWFDKDFAPRKIDEVKSYSSYRIRLPEKIFSFLKTLFGKQYFFNANEAENIAESYVGYVHNKKKEAETPFKVYPHRDKSVSSLLTLQPKKALNYIEQTSKYYDDYGKAYKGIYHFLRDSRQPLQGIYHLTTSLLKIGFAFPILALKMTASLIYPGKHQTRLQSLKKDFINFGMRLSEGFSQLLLGSTLMVVGTLFYPFKLIARGTQTAVAYFKNKGPLQVENNTGIQRLVKQAAIDTNIETYNAIRVQIHRKYRNAVEKGQASDISELKEKEAFNNCRPDNPETYVNYLSLFKTQHAVDVKFMDVLSKELKRGPIKRDFFMGGKNVSVDKLLIKGPEKEVSAFFEDLIINLPPEKLRKLFQEEGYRACPGLLKQALNNLITGNQYKYTIDEKIMTNVLVTVRAFQKYTPQTLDEKTKEAAQQWVRNRFNHYLQVNRCVSYDRIGDKFNKELNSFFAGENQSLAYRIINKGSIGRLVADYKLNTFSFASSFKILQPNPSIERTGVPIPAEGPVYNGL